MISYTCLRHEISDKKYNRFSGNARKFSTTRSHVEGCASVFPSQYRNISPAVTISRTKMDRGTWNMVIRLIMHSISPASALCTARCTAFARSNTIKPALKFEEGIRVSRDISLLSWRFVARSRGVFFTAVSHLSGDLNHQDLKICGIIFLGSERWRTPPPQGDFFEIHEWILIRNYSCIKWCNSIGEYKYVENGEYIIIEFKSTIIHLHNITFI